MKVDDVLTGQINQRTSTVSYVTNPDIVGEVDAYVGKVGFFDSDLGKISASSQKITDSNYFKISPMLSEVLEVYLTISNMLMKHTHSDLSYSVKLLLKMM